MTTAPAAAPWLESCLTSLDPPWWIPPFRRELIGRCWSCDYPTHVESGLVPICIHCLAGCPVYGEQFRCEYEARLAWLGMNLQRGGALRPFPGDYDSEASPYGRPRGASRGAGYGLLRGFRQVNLAAYVSRFTELTPVGPGQWKGRCPIHSEKTPSFTVSANPWRWHCFGACATGGDIIKLIAELRRVGKWHDNTQRQ